jgi:antitoxin CptB
MNTINIPQTNVETADLPLESRKKRLIFRSWHRGTREMDILMGNFADSVVPNLTPAQVEDYERLLDCPDPDLYDWYTQKSPVPEEEKSGVMGAFLGFKLKSRE